MPATCFQRSGELLQTSFVDLLKMQERCRAGLLDPIISAMIFMKRATKLDNSHFVNLQGTCVRTVLQCFQSRVHFT